MTSFDSASQRLEKSLDRLESAVASRLAHVETTGAKDRDEAEQSRAKSAALSDANQDAARRLDETIARITRLLEA